MATCKCKRGHTWTTRVLADEPDTNSMTVEEVNCPECGTDEFEVIDVDYSDD